MSNFQNTLKIAVIDSGIDFNHPRLSNLHGKEYHLINDKVKRNSNGSMKTREGHGTACAYIISKFISCKSEIVSIRIIEPGLITKEADLVRAINWCIENKISLINISLGISTNYPSEDLTSACELAFANNIFIVAASDNDINKVCYPAFYPWVYGVKSGKPSKFSDYCFEEENSIQFIAKGSIQRVPWINNSFKIVTGTSFAAPHITGIIASILENSPMISRDELHTKLKNGSVSNIKLVQTFGYNKYNLIHHNIVPKKIENHGERLFTNKGKFDWIENLAVFPASEKEMKQFEVFPDQCIADRITFIDYPVNLKNVNKKYICDKDKIPYDKFDSLVVGYYYDNLWEGNVDFGNSILDESISRGKNIFCYDYRLHKFTNLNKIKGSINYLPAVNKDKYIEVLNFQYLPLINVPIIMVVGTGNRQGKFTTQLRLKEILIKNNYCVSHIATEPQGELFGASFCFPYGYMNTVDLNSTEYLLFLRTLCKGVCHYNKPDILLTGSQGGLLPREPLNVNPYLGAVNSVSFVYGILPDIIICAINPEDDISLIKSTIKIAEIYAKSHLAFYVITPYTRQIRGANNSYTTNYVRLTDEELVEKIEFFEQELNGPVINIMDYTNDDLVMRIIEKICS